MAKTRERRCIVTGDEPPEAQLVRFALGPDGAVYPDVAAQAPGRGAWIRSARTHVETAVRRNLFSRAFKTAAAAPADLADRTEAALSARCLSVLGLAKKAGALAIGFDQVEAALKVSRPLGLVEAVDGSADGRDKLLKLAKAAWNDPPPVVGCFTGEEIGVALGRDRVIHACWLQERFARVWTAEIGRLAGFRPITPDGWGTASWLAATEAVETSAKP
jgi:predicted RNA-binding protein YlxR (DUF448 family)